MTGVIYQLAEQIKESFVQFLQYKQATCLKIFCRNLKFLIECFSCESGLLVLYK